MALFKVPPLRGRERHGGEKQEVSKQVSTRRRFPRAAGGTEALIPSSTLTSNGHHLSARRHNA